MGLFDSINLARESLQVQRQGIEVAGHNIANVNTPGYARQRLNLVTAPSRPGLAGPTGGGVRSEGIQQLRDGFLDQQVRGELSVGGFLKAQEMALDQGQSVLGQQIDRFATGAEASAAALGVGGQHALAERISTLFTEFSNLANSPADPILRTNLLQKAQDLAGEFNRVDGRLGELNSHLTNQVGEMADEANELLASIAQLNADIVKLESGKGVANDLRDLRLQKVEALAQLVDLDVVSNPNGTLDVRVGGETLVAGVMVEDTLEAFSGGVRTQTGGVPLVLTAGAIQGTIVARDGALETLRSDIDQLAATLITTVNGVHRGGYSLNGTTGEDFFTGTNAADIGVNGALVVDPTGVQASDTLGKVGNNKVALLLSDLGNQPLLSGRTLTEEYGRIVSGLGSAVSSVNSQMEDQRLVDEMLVRQRDSVMGVSMDEEMTEMIKFQRAFEASARLITTLDEMLTTVVNLKR